MPDSALTWACHVCGDVRPDEAISVHTDRKDLGIAVEEVNVRYCNDRPGCAAGAYNVAAGWLGR